MGKFIEGNEERRLSLELYRKDKLFGVYISDNEGGSGITVEEPSPEEAAKEAAKYIADYFYEEEDDEEEDEEDDEEDEEKRDRFTLLYDGEEGELSMKYLKNAIFVALADYAEGGYDKIEIYDNEKEKVVWTTDSDEEDGYYDINGNEICVGDRVIWHDPDESAIDLDRVYIVHSFSGEIVYIADDISTAEVFASELEVVEH